MLVFQLFIKYWQEKAGSTLSKKATTQGDNMTDLEQLIETGYRLSNTLSIMANNEIRFGHELGRQLEYLSWESLKIADDLKSIRSQLVGGVA